MNARTVNAIANAKHQAQLEARRGQCPAEIPAALYQLELYAGMPASATADLVTALQRAAAELTALADRTAVRAAAAEGLSGSSSPRAERPAARSAVARRHESSFPGSTS